MAPFSFSRRQDVSYTPAAEAIEGNQISRPQPPNHQPSRVSTTDSIYDEIDPSLPQPACEYGFYYTGLHRHLVICLADAQKTPRYFAEMSEFTRHKPDVTLHEVKNGNGLGRDGLRVEQLAAGPTLAVVHFPKFSRNFKIGIGDPAVGEVVWEELKNCKKLAHSEYRFEWSENGGALRFSNDIPTSTRRSYTWLRTRHAEDGLGGGRWSTAFDFDSYKLIRDDGVILAVFLNNGAKSWKKKGKLRIYDTGDSWERLGPVAVLTIVAILEKARRRRNSSKGGGGA